MSDERCECSVKDFIIKYNKELQSIEQLPRSFISQFIENKRTFPVFSDKDSYPDAVSLVYTHLHTCYVEKNYDLKGIKDDWQYYFEAINRIIDDTDEKSESSSFRP